MNEIKKLKDEDYFNAEGVSNSFLTQFDRSPEHAKAGIEETLSMKLGTMLHKYLLEPLDFFKIYHVLPDSIPKDKRLKIYKEYVLSNGEFEYISKDDLKGLEAIKNSLSIYKLYESITALEFIEQSEKEMCYFWTEKIMDIEIQRRAKLDLHLQKGFINMIAEIKKTQDCRTFYRSVINYQYARQAATYQDAVKALTGHIPDIPFITIEMTAPFGVMAFELDNEYIEWGRNENFKSLCNYIKWKESGCKPELYKDGIHKIEMPNFLRE
jgi:hypothetical protein